MSGLSRATGAARTVVAIALILVGVGGLSRGALIGPDGSPTVGDPNLVFWLKASDLSGTHSDGAPVATWAAAQTVGSDATQGSAARQPTFSQSVAALKNQPAVSFDGADDFLATTGVIPATGSNPRTIIAVLSGAGDVGAPYRHAVHYGTTAGGQAYGLTPKALPSQTGGGDHVGNHYWGSGFASFEPPSDEARVVTLQYNGSLDQLWSNGLYQGANQVGLNTGNATSLQIGSRMAGPAETLSGNLAELIIYDQTLSDAERNAVEGYLRGKYGLATLPPRQVDLTTAGGVQARYTVGLGRAYSDTVITPENPNGSIDYSSGRGNGLPWWTMNDGIISGNQNINTFAATSTTDFVGYRFDVPVKNISRIDFANRVFGDGGTFDATPTLQYLDAPLEKGGTWHDVAATFDTPYDRSVGGSPMRPYSITPVDQSLSGVWGVRLIGAPNTDRAPGADPTGFIALSELRVVGEVDLMVDFSQNLAHQSNGATAIMTHAQSGNPGAINDGNLLSREQTFGAGNQGEDFVGVLWQEPQDNVRAVGITFKRFVDGGLFDDAVSPFRIEVTHDGTTWTPVSGLDKFRYDDVYQVLADFTDDPPPNFYPEMGFLFTFSPVFGIQGIRAIGDPDGYVDGDGFLGVFEFEAYSILIPEPTTLSLLGLGGIATWLRRRKKR